MINPLLLEAAEDRRVKGAPLHVLVFLHKILVMGEYREAKHWYVAEKTGIDRRHVGKALARLVELGYLRIGEKNERNVATYMLLLSRAINEAPLVSVERTAA